MTILVTAAPVPSASRPSVCSAPRDTRCGSSAASPASAESSATSRPGQDSPRPSTASTPCCTSRTADVQGGRPDRAARRRASTAKIATTSSTSRSSGSTRTRSPYYQQKLESERLIEASGIPFTILRATQFHDFIAMFLRPQRRMPVVILPKTPVQPIAVDEVAARIVELVDAGPSGHVARHRGPRAARRRGVRHRMVRWPTATEAALAADAPPGQDHARVPVAA